MKSKILRSDVIVNTEKTNLPSSALSPNPVPSELVNLVKNLETRTFEIEKERKHSLLAIRDRRVSMSCGIGNEASLTPAGSPGLYCSGFATYNLSPTCGVIGRQYIKSVECNGNIAVAPHPNYPTEPARIKCTASGNTKTIFVMD